MEEKAVSEEGGTPGRKNPPSRPPTTPTKPQCADAKMQTNMPAGPDHQYTCGCTNMYARGLSIMLLDSTKEAQNNAHVLIANAHTDTWIPYYT